MPLSAGLRPTPNRVRETLFNWLQPYVPGASCLDLFSGTGALCLEALSRGAGSAVMVEQAALAAAALKNNVAMLGAERAQVIHADALAFLADGGLSGKNSTPSFDIIFIDPPFRSELIERCIKLISTHGWLNSGGLVYVEAPRNFGNLELPSSWEIINSKKTGRVGYHLARNRL